MTALPQSPVIVVTPPPEVTPLLDAQDSSQPPSDVVNDSNEEFRPAVDCVETNVCVQVSDESGEYGTSSDETFLVSRPCCSMTCGQFLAEWERLSDSMYLLPIHLLLLGLPLITLYIGGQNLLECPGCQFLPIMLFLMGFSGTVAAGCNIYNIVYNFVFPGGHGFLPKGSFLIPIFALVAVYSAELLYFYKSSISFDSEKTNYCKRDFYNFAYYINWLHVAASVVVVLLYYPKLCVCLRRAAVQGS